MTKKHGFVKVLFLLTTIACVAAFALYKINQLTLDDDKRKETFDKGEKNINDKIDKLQDALQKAKGKTTELRKTVEEKYFTKKDYTDRKSVV